MGHTLRGFAPEHIPSDSSQMGRGFRQAGNIGLEPSSHTFHSTVTVGPGQVSEAEVGNGEEQGNLLRCSLEDPRLADHPIPCEPPPGGSTKPSPPSSTPTFSRSF